MDVRMVCAEPEYMPEAAVSVRLALWISKLPGTSKITVALDRMHIWASEYTERSTGRTVPKKVICDVDELLVGWESEYPNLKPWCNWRQANSIVDIGSATTPPNAEHTVCDIEAPFALGKLRVESKQVKNKVQEQSHLQSGIGQMATIRDFSEGDFLAVAVPYSPRLMQLARRFQEGPIFRRTEIGLVLVHNHGPVDWITPDTERWKAFRTMAAGTLGRVKH